MHLPEALRTLDHAARLMAALHTPEAVTAAAIDGSPRLKNGVLINAAVTVACIDMAQPLLHELAPNDTLRRVNAARSAETAHLVNLIPDEEWQELLNPNPHERACCKYDASNGAADYFCPTGSLAPQAVPCFKCPFAIAAAGPQTRPSHKPGPLPASTPAPDAETAAVATLHALIDTAQALAESRHPPSTTLFSAVLTLGNAGYFAAAAHEHLQHTLPKAQRTQLLNNLLSALNTHLYLALGGTDCGPLLSDDHYQEKHYCSRGQASDGEIHYFCNLDLVGEYDTDQFPEPCARCDFHSTPHRPTITDLMQLPPAPQSGPEPQPHPSRQPGDA